MASRSPNLNLLVRSKITKLINLKYEYFVDSTCANLRNMNFTNKYESVIPTRKNGISMDYEYSKMKNPVEMKMALEFMKFCNIRKFYG